MTLLSILSALLLSASDAPPNVVWLISDDQAWGDYSFLDHPNIQTPHLDRLASQSLVFPHGYVPTSLCRPSLATMITGLYPHQNRITSNDPSLPPDVPKRRAMANPKYREARHTMASMIAKLPTLPRILGEHGYVSLQTGKWWEEDPQTSAGFNEAMTHGDVSRGGRHGDVGLKIGREGVQPVLDFIDQSADANKPFFVWYAPMPPHQPHNPPERILKKYRDKTDSEHVAKYWAMCEWFDETCGEILSHLDKRGLSDNTLVVYVTDNGWIQDPANAHYAERSKRSPNEGGIRTPIMFRWHGHIEPATSNDLASSIDLLPTTLAAVDIPAPKDLPGINLLDPNARKERDFLTGEIFTHDAVDIQNPASSLRYRWIIDGRWKLIVPDKRNEPDAKTELYELSTDPAETKDLASAHPDTVDKLMKKLNAWWDPMN